jgi:hypothetical protein
VTFAASGAWAFDVPDFANRKLLKAKRQMMVLENQGDELGGDQSSYLDKNTIVSNGQISSDPCAGVNIGNLSADQKIRGDLTVIVTGDIINRGGVCR